MLAQAARHMDCIDDIDKKEITKKNRFLQEKISEQ
jgi:hypothetical protein